MNRDVLRCPDASRREGRAAGPRWGAALLVLACSAAVPLVAAGRAEADVAAYTSRSGFLADVPGGAAASTVDFESQAAGGAVTSIGGIGFSSSDAGYPLIVDSQFPTTSGSKYLAVDDPDNQNQILAGNELTFHLAPGVFAIGMSIIVGSDPIFPTELYEGDIFLEASQDGETWTSPNSTAYEAIPQGNVYFLGLRLIEGGSLSQVRLRYHEDAVNTFFFNVDDVVQVANVPEPSPLVLLGLTTLVGAGVGWHRRRRAAGRRRGDAGAGSGGR